MKKFILSILLLPLVMACKPKEPNIEMHPGEADFSKFVAIGDGHMGGYMDDALSVSGQQSSLGAMIQNQLLNVGAQGIQMPWMEALNIGVNKNGLSRLILGYKTDCLGTTSLSPVRFATFGEQGSLTTSAYNPSQKFSNFGTPGIRMIDLVSTQIGNPNSIDYNPYFARMSMDQFILPWTGYYSSMQENILMGGYPSFCVIYLGVEDVLPYAKSGATQNQMSPIDGLPGIGFGESLTQFCEQLSAQNVKAAIATIPNITDWPYFTTIPYNGLKLDEEKAASLNQIYSALGFSFHVGDNPFMIVDPNAGMFGVRPIEAGEKILLSVPLDSVKCNQMGSIFPLRDEFVLNLEEIIEIQTRIDQFNALIIEKATDYGFAVVYTSDFYENLTTGFAYNGVSMSAKFVSGGAFSLDGIHLNPRGNALLANEFIKSINSKFKSKITQINALNYNAVLFP